MLKRISIKKIITSCIVLSIAFLICFIPNGQEEEKNYNYEVNYVNKDIKTHTIYLLDSNNYISKTNIRVTSDKPEELAKELIEALIENSSKQDAIPSGFKSLINSNTKINSLKIDNETIKVDLSKSLLDTTKELEESTIEALVYTLTSIENIDYVIIYLDGNILTKLPQNNINLPSTLSRDIGINKKYDLNSTKNITNTTTYFISKFNDNYYYTPITTVSNDEREKIEIIIDSLSSSAIDHNLMSFMNNNATLLNFEIESDTITVNFDENILNNLEEYKILEEVLYTISLSIYDNYHAKEVIFMVNNEKITETTSKSLE